VLAGRPLPSFPSSQLIYIKKSIPTLKPSRPAANCERTNPTMNERTNERTNGEVPNSMGDERSRPRFARSQPSVAFRPLPYFTFDSLLIGPRVLPRGPRVLSTRASGTFQRVPRTFPRASGTFRGLRAVSRGSRALSRWSRALSAGFGQFPAGPGYFPRVSGTFPRVPSTFPQGSGTFRGPRALFRGSRALSRKARVLSRRDRVLLPVAVTDFLGRQLAYCCWPHTFCTAAQLIAGRLINSHPLSNLPASLPTTALYPAANQNRGQTNERTNERRSAD
jgi:hypothetical protein